MEFKSIMDMRNTQPRRVSLPDNGIRDIEKWIIGEERKAAVM